MRPITGISICVALFFAGSGVVSGQTPEAPTAEQIATWVKQLDSDLYGEREEANARLIAAGGPAVKTVAQAAANGGPEVTWRAVTILEKIGVGGSEETLLAVSKSLTLLGEKGNQRAARIGGSLQAAWRMKRHERAVAALRKMGAELTQGVAVSSYPGTPIYPSSGPVPIYSTIPVEVDSTSGYSVDDIIIEGDVIDRIYVEPTELKVIDPSLIEGLIPSFESPDESADYGEEVELDIEEGITEEGCEGSEPVEEAQTEEVQVDESEPLIIVEEVEEPLVDFVFEEVEGGYSLRGRSFRVAPSYSLPVMPAYGAPGPPGAYVPTGSIVIGESWKGGDEGLKYLRDLIGFTTITFQNRTLTDEAMKHIAGMGPLTVLTLQNCSYEPSVIDDFRKTRPNVQVRAFADTVLGVAGNPDVSPFVISHVQPETGASKAGLQVGDTIVSVDGEKLANFSQLTFLVASKKIGDELTLEIQREGKTMVRKAKLGARADVEPAP